MCFTIYTRQDIQKRKERQHIKGKEREKRKKEKQQISSFLKQERKSPTYLGINPKKTPTIFNTSPQTGEWISIIPSLLVIS